MSEATNPDKRPDWLRGPFYCEVCDFIAATLREYGEHVREFSHAATEGDGTAPSLEEMKADFERRTGRKIGDETHGHLQEKAAK